MKNVLITGSTGFIGKNLKEQLRNKYHLFAPIHQELELTDHEEVQNYLKRNSIESIVHCASAGARGFKGRGAVRQPETIGQNLRMFFNIESNLHGRRLINFGSGAEYDKRFSIERVREEDCQHSPPEDYAFSKYVMSKYVENSDQLINHLRFFSVYGKYEDYKIRFISKAICRNLLGKPIIINQNANFDYLYVDDAIKIVDYFIQNGGSKKIYNVGAGNPTDLVTIAQTINDVADKPSEITIRTPGFNVEYTCDITRLMEETGEFQFTPLRDGIRRLYDYYKDNLGSLDCD